MTTSEVSIKGYSEPGDGSRGLPEATMGVSGAGKGKFRLACSHTFLDYWVFVVYLSSDFCVSGCALFYSLVDAETALYTELWRACAGPLVTVPREGELVFYFPQGHIEQVCFLALYYFKIAISALFSIPFS